MKKLMTLIFAVMIATTLSAPAWSQATGAKTQTKAASSSSKDDKKAAKAKAKEEKKTKKATKTKK